MNPALLRSYSEAGGWGIDCGFTPGPISTAWQMRDWTPGSINLALFGAPDDRPVNDNHPQ